MQVVHSLRQGHQAMVFVHSRKDTGKTARALAVKAQNMGEAAQFDCSEEESYGLTQRDVKRSRNKCGSKDFFFLSLCSDLLLALRFCSGQ